MSDYQATVPPHDLEAEQSLIASVLLDNKVLAYVLEEVDVCDFYSERHREFFEVILRLWGDNIPIDEVTFANELRTRGTFERHDGRTRVAEVFTAIATASNAVHYARIVHNLALCRDFGQTAYQIALDSRQARTPEFLVEAQSQLDRVHSRLIAPREPTTAETAGTILRDMRENRQPPRFATGLRIVDAALDGGLGRGELIVLAGLTGRGKSALAAQIALATAAADSGVLFVSLEMSREQLIERALCAEARVNLGARINGFTPEQDAALQQALKRLAVFPLDFKYRPGIKPAQLRALAQRFHREHPNFGLLVVDYLNLMESGRREERREREVATITMALQHLAGELRIAVLALSQFNRGPAREDRAPRLSDLRDSGAIEQDATIVMFLHEKKADDDGDLDIIIAKNRRGQPWVGLPTRFIASQTRFEDRT
jgi:replicative DNA helicase